MNIAVDLDGTLITCEAKQLGCLRSALRRCGQTADLEGVWRAKRGGLTTRQSLLQAGLTEWNADAVTSIWVESVEKPFWLSFDRAFPDVNDALITLSLSGTKPTLLTARNRPEWLIPQLRALGLAPYLANVVVVPPQTASKSKAVALAEAQADVFIGDSESDLQASLTAGVLFAAVSSGQRSKEYLLMKGALHVFSSFNEAIVACASIRG
jgi:phosphoglycolate phosphatase-like HAD superfamily hydrolase